MLGVSTFVIPSPYTVVLIGSWILRTKVKRCSGVWHQLRKWTSALWSIDCKPTGRWRHAICEPKACHFVATSQYPLQPPIGVFHSEWAQGRHKTQWARLLLESDLQYLLEIWTTLHKQYECLLFFYVCWSWSWSTDLLKGSVRGNYFGPWTSSEA